MKKLVILLIPILMQSCTMYKGIYTVGLHEVERPEDSKTRYGESKVEKITEEGKSKYLFEDELIRIVWLAGVSQLGFDLENKTDHSIKIIWDEVVYVDETGSSQRIMHSGIKYTDRNNSQPPTIVPRGAKINDIIMPTDNVYYVSGQYGGWRELPLFNNKASTQDELNRILQENIGKIVKVLFPIEVQGVVNEYTFSFKVEDFVQSSSM